MPRFFFHIRDAYELIVDEEGIVLKDLTSARKEAIRAARDMFEDARIGGEAIAHQVFEICDQKGNILLKVPVSEGRH